MIRSWWFAAGVLSAWAVACGGPPFEAGPDSGTGGSGTTRPGDSAGGQAGGDSEAGADSNSDCQELLHAAEEFATAHQTCAWAGQRCNAVTACCQIAVSSAFTNEAQRLADAFRNARCSSVCPSGPCPCGGAGAGACNARCEVSETGGDSKCVLGP